MKVSQGRSGGYSARYTLIGIFMVIAAAVLMVSQVRSADVNMFLQGYQAEEGQLSVYCAYPASEKEPYEPQQFTATISGQECPVLEVSTVEQRKEGVTYYCLVDVSGSMHQEQMEKAKAVLSEICGRLRKKDNMVIGEIGATLKTSDFLTDKVKIKEIIEGLSGESDYTAIHDAVVDSISVLQTNNSCNRKKCLVLISDGDDDTELGTTGKEAMDAVTGSRIPVYTVAVMRQSPNEEQKEAAENLGAFARQSAGGIDYPPVGKDHSDLSEEFDAEEAGRVIVEHMQGGMILTLDTSGVEKAKDELLLKVSFKTDTNTYHDTLYLYAADLNTPKIKQTEAAETESDTAETESDTVQSETNGGDLPDPEPPVPPAALLAGLAAAAVILLSVVLIFMKKKAKMETEKREAAEREEEEKSAWEQEEEDIPKAEDMLDAAIAVSAPEPCYEVKFTAINYAGIVFTLQIPKKRKVTVGRTQEADLVLNPNDKYLSSVQCKVYCMQDSMKVWDMNSQNGTFVNGVPVRQVGMAVAQNNDLIRMGSYEYRINIFS